MYSNYLTANGTGYGQAAGQYDTTDVQTSLDGSLSDRSSCLAESMS